MADPCTWALVGSDTLLGREVRERMESSGLPVELRLIAAGEEGAGRLTEQSGEAAMMLALEKEHLHGAGVVLLAVPELKAAAMAPEALIVDLAHAAEDLPDARLRAPMVEPDPKEAPREAVHVIAHPAAIALALFLRQLAPRHPIRRTIANVFQPASERGAGGIEELQQQTVNLLSFKSLPKQVYDAQVSFNLLARYGEEAPVALEDVELRVERHLATLLSLGGRPAPMPSLRLIQAPVFHGHSFSLWVEFEENPGVEALEAALAGESIDVRGGDLEPPTNVSFAGESGIAVGGVRLDRSHPQACWFWMVADNLRLVADNAVEAARHFL